jgi:hypothetical protein
MVGTLVWLANSMTIVFSTRESKTLIDRLA